MRIGRLLVLLSPLPALLAQNPAFKPDKLHGRNAWVLENDRVRLSALRGGGFIGEIRFKSPDARKSINPMRVPHYQTIDPYEYDQARHAAIYGSDTQRRLMAGYMGHFLCFPHFGPPSSEHEIKAEYNNHGEAILVEWKQDSVNVRADDVTFRYHADLPQTQYRVEREIVLPAGESVFYVQEWVENLVTYDRPINWVQHVTFGPPFVEPGRNYLDAPVVRVDLGQRRQGGGEAGWPTATAGGSQIDLRQFTSQPHTGRYHALLLDTSRKVGYFTSYHTGYPVLIGYLFPTAMNPWIGDWQENQRATNLPWAGKAVARGMEVGTTPFAEGLRRSVERSRLFDVPTYRWIGGRQRMHNWYAIFLAEIPAGFRGVADVRKEASRIVIEERGTGRLITVTSGRPLPE
ncbi:MAG: hypothetical protein IT158_26415 [Bryobacterales bacterium]|nr:hypothetical protein [Bryobacterales bacterium]